MDSVREKTLDRIKEKKNALTVCKRIGLGDGEPDRAEKEPAGWRWSESCGQGDKDAGGMLGDVKLC